MVGAGGSKPTITILAACIGLAGCGNFGGWSRDVHLQRHHPNGSVLKVTNAQHMGSQVRLSLVVTNGSGRIIKLNANQDMVVQDQVGGSYALDPPADNPEVAIPPGQTVEGSFLFEAEKSKPGPITLITNSKLGNDRYERTDRPKFVVAIAPDRSADEIEAKTPEALALDRQVNHPNGAVLRVTRAEFAPTETRISMAVTNGFSRPISLNAHSDMELIDNLANRYRLAAPPDNPRVSVTSASSLDAQLRFLGGLHPKATEITLVTNERLGNADYELTDRPQMRISIPISR